MRSRLLKVFAAGTFARNVALLSLGSLAGRAIALLALPWLTRIYSPHDFGVLAVFLAVVSIITVSTCLRFEVAIPQAETDEDAAHLFILAALAATIISFALVVALTAIPGRVLHILSILSAESLEPYIWLLPASIWLIGIAGAVQFWSARRQRFAAIASNRAVQSVISVVVMIALGLLKIAPLGLLIGNVINAGAGALWLGWDILRREAGVFSAIRAHRLKCTLLKFYRFPLFSAPDAFLNAASAHAPILMIASRQSIEAGYLILAIQVMAIPMSLLGSSITQVYAASAAGEYRAGVLAPYTATIIRGLIKVGWGPILFAGLIAPALFPLMFGTQWQRAATIVTWMVPWIALQFTVSPVSAALNITNRQLLMLMLNLVGIIIRVGAVMIAMALAQDALPEVYALSGAAFYAVYLAIVVRVTGIRLRELCLDWKESSCLFIAWAAAAALVRLVFYIL